MRRPSAQSLTFRRRRVNEKQKRVQILLVSLGVIATLVGFVIGTRSHQPTSPLPKARDAAPGSGEVYTAPSYESIRLHRASPTTPFELERLTATSRDFPESVTVPVDARPASLAARAQRRAYHGAPPTVPHPIPQGGDLPCLECHASGFQIDGVAVPKMSHRLLTSCTQCHVTELGSAPASPPPWDIHNTFTGMASPTSGKRAWPGAPPTIPHTTFMREDCMSCHHPNSRPGLQTSHPWRQSCQQCHASSSALDQAAPAFAGGLR